MKVSFNVEYSGVSFAVLFLFEYSNLFYFRCLLSGLFFNIKINELNLKMLELTFSPNTSLVNQIFGDNE